MNKMIKRLIVGLGVLIAVLILNPISIIGPNQRGVNVLLGKAGDETLQPGVNFHVPLVGAIKKWKIVPHDYRVKISIDSNGAISSDNQIIGVDTVIYWKYDERKIPEIAKTWSETRITDVINTSATSAIKATIGAYTIFDLAANQGEIGSIILAKLQSSTTNLPVEITQVNVQNFDWSPEFDKQINATMAAAQRVREAEQQANIAEQENRKLSIEAEAKAKALVAQAEGDKQAAELHAQARRAEGEGIADYNRLIAQNMTVEIRLKELEIELERAKRWNGVEVPTYIPLTPAGGIVTLPAK